MEILQKYKDYLLARKQSLVYFNYMKLFLEYCEFEKIDYTKLIQENITNFFNTTNYSINSRNNFIKAGRSFYTFLGQQDTEWTKIALMKPERRLPQYLSEVDLKKAIKYISTYNDRLENIQKIEALLYFMYYTGLRKGELLNLKREWFNLEKKSVKVWGSKSRQDRMVYYPDFVREKIEKYFNSEKEEINSFNITLGQVNYLSLTIGKHLGKKVYPHLWRHSACKNLIEKGMPLNIVSKILGHQDIKTTMLYAEPDEEMIERIYNQKIK